MFRFSLPVPLFFTVFDERRCLRVVIAQISDIRNYEIPTDCNTNET